MTGGQIPTDFFDPNRGFNDTVQPLATLISENQQPDDLDAAYEVGDINRINNITTRVVGTSEQQWYIKKKLYGIVSHLTFSGGSFVKQILPITNNFAAIYKSPSFASAVLGDLFVQVTPLASMFSFDDMLQLSDLFSQKSYEGLSIPSGYSSSGGLETIIEIKYANSFGS